MISAYINMSGLQQNAQKQAIDGHDPKDLGFNCLIEEDFDPLYDLLICCSLKIALERPCTRLSNDGIRYVRPDPRSSSKSYPRNRPRGGSKAPLLSGRPENGRLMERLTTRREILWWNIYAGMAQKLGRFKDRKLLMLNNLTRWRGKSHSNSR
jgi:hypothetical protein